jgi:hypothetical protein
MNQVMTKILGVNWKTTLAGIAAFLSGVPGFVNALTAWGNHQAVNWREVLVSVALAAIGAGLAAAKDGTTHSTTAQVETATAKAVETTQK